MPSQEHEAVVAGMLENKLTDAPSLEEMRQNFDLTFQEEPVAAGVEVSEIQIGDISGLWLAAEGGDRVILYLHGGGYAVGSPIAYRGMTSRIASAANAQVCLIDYRLAPENPFPAGLEDALATYRWLVGEKDIDPATITIAGDSAGGGLTLATLLALKEAGDPLPGCACVFSPWTDVSNSSDSMAPGAVDDPLFTKEAADGMAQMYAAGQFDNPLVSPLLGDLTGLPPLLIQVGEREALLDDSVKFADKAREAEVEVQYFSGQGLIHVWPLFAAQAPESIEAIERLASFVRVHCPG